MTQWMIIGTVAILLTGCSAGRVSGCGYNSLVGQSIYKADLDSIRASGKEVRLLYPDSYLGFEKNDNRVNVIRDDTAEIVAVTCG